MVCAVLGVTSTSLSLAKRCIQDTGYGWDMFVLFVIYYNVRARTTTKVTGYKYSSAAKSLNISPLLVYLVVSAPVFA
jgi:hypothetical protein